MSVRVATTLIGADSSSIAEAVVSAASSVSLVGAAREGAARLAHSSAAHVAAARARP